MKRLTYLLIVGVTLLSLGSGNAFGQATASATIQGTVTDKSGAVVSGAQVVAKNKATDVTRTTDSSDTGYYRFELLPVGTYTVTITKAGFGTVVQTIETLIGQVATANAELKPGATSEVIEVTSDALLLDQTKTSVSQTITPSEVEELPMVGRDVANLAYLSPGVKAADSYDPTKNRYAILSVNGANGRNVNVTVNGVDNKDNTVGGPVMQLPLEAVQEFVISTQRFSAVNGRSEGAAINMITKQGTNNYHGSVFGFFRDTSLNTDEKDPTGTGPTPAHPDGTIPSHPNYTRQQFGGSVGGPFRKDKLFGFFAIEREREHQAQTVDASSFNQLTLAKANGFADQPAATIPRPFFEWRYNTRLDWVINSKNSAYLSYTSQVNDSLNDQSDATFDLTEGNFTKNHLIVSNFTLNSILSPTLVNQFTLGYQYWNNLIDSNLRAPNFIFPHESFGTNTNVPQQSFQKKWQFKDDVSKTVGRHTFEVGVDFINNPVEGGFFEFNPTLLIRFAADPSAIVANGGFGTRGLVTEMSIANGNPFFLVATKQLGFYGQDNWKVNKRLTLNLGLRWDKDFNMIGGADIRNSRTYQELVALNSPISNPLVSKIAKDDNKDFSPRIGFAYDLTGQSKHVIRGGYGLYFGNVFQNIPLFMEQQANATIFQTLFDITDPKNDIVPGTGIPLGQWRCCGPPNGDPLPTINPPSSQLNPLSIGRLMAPNYRNPVTEEFNGGYSWALNANTAFEVEYTHVLGLHGNKTINTDQKVPVNGVCCTRPLDAAFNASNPPLPKLGSVRVDESINREHYDGVNFSFRQRMSHRFQLSANYTLGWAYSYDGGGGSYRNYPRLSTNPFASYEWGPSFNDERHHVTVSGIVDLPKGFQLSPILQFGSARPYNVTNSSSTLNTGGGTFPAVVVPTNDPTNYLAFTGNNAGAQNCFYGLNGVAQGCTIAKYDPLRGDPFFELDMRLAKNIKFGDRMNLQLVAQAFNLTNRANYGNNFGHSIASVSTFGHPAGFINPSSTIVPRSVWGEVGARFTF